MSAPITQLKRNDAELRAGGWYQVNNRGELLRGKTIGFIGVGRIARETAKRLQGWGLVLLGADPHIEPGSVSDLGIRIVDRRELLQRSDVVSLHVALTSETRNLISRAELELMKSSAYLINTARGGAIDERALAEALSLGTIAGAALDVFNAEPLEPGSPLRQVDPLRLIVTPHIIGHDRNVEESGFRLAVGTIRKILSGEAPDTVVNKSAVGSWHERFWS
jgi:D-3-phosphoglycerate dehydrogenase